MITTHSWKISLWMIFWLQQNLTRSVLHWVLLSLIWKKSEAQSIQFKEHCVLWKPFLGTSVHNFWRCVINSVILSKVKNFSPQILSSGDFICIHCPGKVFMDSFYFLMPLGFGNQKIDAHHSWRIWKGNKQFTVLSTKLILTLINKNKQMYFLLQG